MDVNSIYIRLGSSKKGGRFIAVALLAILFPILMLLGTGTFAFNALKMLEFRERKECDRPIGPAEAAERAGYRLGLPTAAKNVRFKLLTESQDTDLFISYEASPEGIQAAMKSELSFYGIAAKWGEHVDYTHARIEFKQFPLSLLVMAPWWWRPFFIRHGYYMRASDGINESCYWVDTDRSKVFYYGHAD